MSRRTEVSTPHEAAAIAWCEDGYRRLAPRVTHEVSIEELQNFLLERLRVGDLEVTLKAIHAAENEHDVIADHCLRQVYRELADAAGGQMTVTLRAFGIRAIARPPVTRGPGRTWHDDWKHDILVGLLVQLTCLQFGLRKSRNRYTRRARQPSGASVVSAALSRCGVELSEDRIRRIHDGLGGFFSEALIAYFSKH